MSSGVHNSPELEAYFVRMALELGTNPTPLYGIDRNDVAIAVKAWLYAQLDRPAARNEMLELWNFVVPCPAYVRDCPPERTMYEADYVLGMSDLYLDWLYSHSQRADQKSED